VGSVLDKGMGEDRDVPAGEGGGEVVHGASHGVGLARPRLSVADQRGGPSL